MFNTIKRNLYFSRMQLLFDKGVLDEKIVPFDDEFYEKLNHTYICGLPVSIHIKYLKPKVAPGKCNDRSLYMFFCFDNAILVRGSNKDLELKYGRENAGHGWIEIGDYVYDPSLMMRFDKDLYYELYQPKDIIKCSKEEYCSDTDCLRFYEDVRSTTLDDFRPHGKKRIDLSTSMPLVIGIAKNSGNQDFVNELNRFITEIQYDEEEIYNELCAEMQKMRVFSMNNK